mmetsp:Transcript_29173/g.25803  ORF Transcript_29173/g.25803 Transcript_29173/m.25803 type:complete len:108 (-) Transcript_29173:172-495(-)
MCLNAHNLNEYRSSANSPVPILAKLYPFKNSLGRINVKNEREIAMKKEKAIKETKIKGFLELIKKEREKNDMLDTRVGSLLAENYQQKREYEDLMILVKNFEKNKIF